MLDETAMVPTEIVDHILGFLHSHGDHTTLETCSVVFPQLVDRHLYSQIILTDSPEHFPLTNPFNDGSYAVDPNKFSLTLIDRPHVANYVHLVRIFVGAPFALDLPVISSILPMLSQIKSITLGTNRRLVWSALDSRFRTAFQNNIRLPSLNEVTILNINSFPLSVFNHCDNLKRLLLFNRCIGDEAVSTSYPRISSLGVKSQTSMTMSSIVSWMKTNTLHSLALLIDSIDLITPFGTLLEACSATLVNLEFKHCWCVEHGQNTDLLFPVLRVPLPLLERIIIRSPIVIFHPRNYLSSLPVLAPFLFSIQIIRPIHLRLHLEFHIPPKIPLLDVDWSDVAAFLVLSVFRHPIELHVNSGSGPLADIVSSFKQNSDLKRLHDAGNLVIKQSMLYNPAEGPVGAIDTRNFSMD